MTRLLLIGVFLEVGIVLVVTPWTRYWDQNYFADLLPFVQAIAGNPFVRGAVSGLGLLNIYVGLAELTSVVLANRTQTPPTSIVLPRTTEESGRLASASEDVERQRHPVS